MDLKWRKMLIPVMPMTNIAPMLSVMKSGTSHYGFSKCIRGYSTVASAPACHAGNASSILATRSKYANPCLCNGAEKRNGIHYLAVGCNKNSP